MPPFWVWLVVIGIIFSAYMTIRTSKEEAEKEMQEAELEGSVYLDRIEAEKEQKSRKRDVQGV